MRTSNANGICCRKFVQQEKNIGRNGESNSCHFCFICSCRTIAFILVAPVTCFLFVIFQMWKMHDNMTAFERSESNLQSLEGNHIYGHVNIDTSLLSCFLCTLCIRKRDTSRVQVCAQTIRFTFSYTLLAIATQVACL